MPEPLLPDVGHCATVETYPRGMDESQGGVRAHVGGDVDAKVYGIGWIGVLAAAAGVVIGVAMMSSGDGSGLVGAATTAVSVSLGVLTYLVTKVLDRQ
ncbi:hypothetical protein [Phycicoccus avicenniae]|uniref:hypothetical protein n=1 Tax=Phycicoccus avicenniae TaxID=2828860 RepID=UPI003D27A921